MKRRKGVVGYFMVFVFLAVVLVVLFGVATPMLIDISAALYRAGEPALDDAQNWIDQIENATVKDQIQDALDSSRDSLPQQIDILAFFYQYGWVIIIVVTLFVIFMATRVQVEQEIR